MLRFAVCTFYMLMALLISDFCGLLKLTGISTAAGYMSTSCLNGCCMVQHILEMLQEPLWCTRAIIFMATVNLSIG